MLHSTPTFWRCLHNFPLKGQWMRCRDTSPSPMTQCCWSHNAAPLTNVHFTLNVLVNIREEVSDAAKHTWDDWMNLLDVASTSKHFEYGTCYGVGLHGVLFFSVRWQQQPNLSFRAVLLETARVIELLSLPSSLCNNSSNKNSAAVFLLKNISFSSAGDIRIYTLFTVSSKYSLFFFSFFKGDTTLAPES